MYSTLHLSRARKLATLLPCLKLRNKNPTRLWGSNSRKIRLAAIRLIRVLRLVLQTMLSSGVCGTSSLGALLENFLPIVLLYQVIWNDRATVGISA